MCFLLFISFSIWQKSERGVVSSSLHVKFNINYWRKIGGKGIKVVSADYSHCLAFFQECVGMAFS